MTLGEDISPVLPDLDELDFRTRAERDRRPPPPVDVQAFWTDYLLGRERDVGFGLVASTNAYCSFMRHQISCLEIESGDVVLDLYFKAITRADRKRASKISSSEDPLEVSTQMLCQMAELEDGSKAFALADVAKLQRELPESELNRAELFLFDISGVPLVDEAKKD